MSADRDPDIELMLAKTLTKEQLAEMEDLFKPGTPAEKCRLCGNRKIIYKYDGHGPICKKCAYGHDSRVTEPRKVVPETGRNEPCTCGSGKKYKKCCIDRKESV